MAFRSGSRGDRPAFGQRAFGARFGTELAGPPPLPRFVAATPSLSAPPGSTPLTEDPLQPARATLRDFATEHRTERDRTSNTPLAPARLGAVVARSRSPPRAGSGSALPRLRQGAPGRHAGQRPPQSSETEADHAKALEDSTDGFYATSSASAVRARRTCYFRLARGDGDRPREPNPARGWRGRYGFRAGKQR